MMSPSQSGSFSRTRGRMGGGLTGLNYPHPFMDLATASLPNDIKEMFQWLRFYFLRNGFFNVVVSKLAEYPITDLAFESSNPEHARKYRKYFETHLRYRQFQVEVGLDYFVYGNTFVSLRYPFTKYLICKSCKSSFAANANRGSWRFQGSDFRLECPKCKETGVAMVQDVSTPHATGARLIRWNPEDISIRYNPLTGRKEFTYRIPPKLRNAIALGLRHVVEETPQPFLEAVRSGLTVSLPPEQVYHMARPSLSGFDQGWGIPLLLPVLGDAFQLQVMRKAHEAVLMEHLVPLRVLFPQAGGGSSDPMVNVPLPLWKQSVADEIARWRHDPNYIPLLPLPIGQQTVGGDGKALLLTAEIQNLCEQIVVQIGVPKEFIFGGASWSGSNVSLRTVENFFLGYLTEHRGLLSFIVSQLRTAFDWPEVDAHFKPFRMAEDLQLKQLLLQARQLNYISATTFLESFNLDPKDEAKLRMRELHEDMEATKQQQIAAQNLQGEIQALAAKQQARLMREQAAAQAPVAGEQGQVAMDPNQAAAQQMQMQAQATTPQVTPAAAFDQAVNSQLQGGQMNTTADKQQAAHAYAMQIATMQPALADAMLRNLDMTDPEMAAQVRQILGQQAAPAVDMRPLPEQRPPRRASLG